MIPVLRVADLPECHYAAVQRLARVLPAEPRPDAEPFSVRRGTAGYGGVRRGTAASKRSGAQMPPR